MRIEPFVALFWALGIALVQCACTESLKQLTQPAGLVSLNSGTGMVLYGRGQLGSISLKKCQLPAFSDLTILFIYGLVTHFLGMVPEVRGSGAVFRIWIRIQEAPED